MHADSPQRWGGKYEHGTRGGARRAMHARRLAHYAYRRVKVSIATRPPPRTSTDHHAAPYVSCGTTTGGALWARPAGARHAAARVLLRVEPG
jgi:hypothetical protein